MPRFMKCFKGAMFAGIYLNQLTAQAGLPKKLGVSALNDIVLT